MNLFCLVKIGKNKPNNLKKENEDKCLNFFCKRFNKRLNADYKYRSLKEEEESQQGKSHIDGSLLSKGKKFPDIKIQITTGEPDLRGWEGKALKGYISKDPDIMDFDIIQWISNAIRKKYSKYKKQEKKQDKKIIEYLVLLIHREVGESLINMINKEHLMESCKKFRECKFQGIYVLTFPLSEKKSSALNFEEVFAIKDIFGEHGKFF
jgi:mRNA-degrading endonuclease YafQ of YafQ-DinJ toxin-antitoxin module